MSRSHCSLLKVRNLFLLISLLFLIPAPALLAQVPGKKSTQVIEKTSQKEIPPEPPEEPLSITRHSVKLNGKNLNYTTKAGYLPIRDDSGKLRAHIFFAAYEIDLPDKSQRPITFAYNGGPGKAASSTVAYQCDS